MSEKTRVFSWTGLATFVYYGGLAGAAWLVSAITEWSFPTLLSACALYVACNERAERLHADD